MICFDCGKINAEALDPLVSTASTATSSVSTCQSARNSSLYDAQSSEYDAQSVNCSSINAENSSDERGAADDVDWKRITSDTPYDTNNSVLDDELSQHRESRTHVSVRVKLFRWLAARNIWPESWWGQRHCRDANPQHSRCRSPFVTCSPRRSLANTI